MRGCNATRKGGTLWTCASETSSGFHLLLPPAHMFEMGSLLNKKHHTGRVCKEFLLCCNSHVSFFFQTPKLQVCFSGTSTKLQRSDGKRISPQLCDIQAMSNYQKQPLHSSRLLSDCNGIWPLCLSIYPIGFPKCIATVLHDTGLNWRNGIS